MMQVQKKSYLTLNLNLTPPSFFPSVFSSVKFEDSQEIATDVLVTETKIMINFNSVLRRCWHNLGFPHFDNMLWILWQNKTASCVIQSKLCGGNISSLQLLSNVIHNFPKHFFCVQTSRKHQNISHFKVLLVKLG